MSELERYRNVIAAPIQLKVRKRATRRVPRDRKAVELALKSQSIRLHELVSEKGFLPTAPPSPSDSEHKERDANPATSTEIGNEPTTLESNSPTTSAQNLPEKQASTDTDHNTNTHDMDTEQADPSNQTDTRTDAEKRFDAIAEQREAQRLRKIAGVSYKDQVDRFNNKLANEPEHFDLFKVSHTK